MKLVCKEQLFPRTFGYRVYDENGDVAFVVKSRPTFGWLLDLYAVDGVRVARLKERKPVWPSEFEMYVRDSRIGDRYLGYVTIEETEMYPTYTISCNGWRIDIEPETRSYTIVDPAGKVVAFIEGAIFPLVKYTINVSDAENVLPVVMFALSVAIKRHQWRHRRRLY